MLVVQQLRARSVNYIVIGKKLNFDTFAVKFNIADPKLEAV
jgi:hypothetical protein